jgi:mannose-1-phosphate guanylyltransferase
VQFDDAHREGVVGVRDAYPVKTFAEKPNLETAERFLESGDFLWNSGMFVWKARAILREIEHHLPDLFAHLTTIRPTLGTPMYASTVERAYGTIKGISIDYGVMERASKVFVVRGDFGWSDVGSWDEVARLSTGDDQGNVESGRVILRDAKNTYVHGESRIIAAVGVEDLIIVESGDAILVCRKGRSQEVKEVVDLLRRKQLNEFL